MKRRVPTDDERKILVRGLQERGYNAHLMAQKGWDETGYRMLVTDTKGKPLWLNEGEQALIWQEWDDPEHFEFVRDWFEEYR